MLRAHTHSSATVLQAGALLRAACGPAQQHTCARCWGHCPAVPGNAALPCPCPPAQQPSSIQARVCQEPLQAEHKTSASYLGELEGDRAWPVLGVLAKALGVLDHLNQRTVVSAAGRATTKQAACCKARRVQLSAPGRLCHGSRLWAHLQQGCCSALAEKATASAAPSSSVRAAQRTVCDHYHLPAHSDISRPC